MLHKVSQNPWLLGNQLMWRYDQEKVNLDMIYIVSIVNMIDIVVWVGSIVANDTISPDRVMG